MHRIVPLGVLVRAASKTIHLSFAIVEIPSFVHGKDIGTRGTSNRWVGKKERGFFFPAFPVSGCTA